ncbi:hypothetical protein [Aeromicrobium sp.]|uniref:hypothetical protein n=1 Tax=Aeromicrobium sp. TaxID=1871063 RepID=UPI0035149755
MLIALVAACARRSWSLVYFVVTVGAVLLAIAAGALHNVDLKLLIAVAVGLLLEEALLGWRFVLRKK